MTHQDADLIRHIVKQHLILVDLISITFYNMRRNYYNMYICIDTYILDITHSAKKTYLKKSTYTMSIKNKDMCSFVRYT